MKALTINQSLRKSGKIKDGAEIPEASTAQLSLAELDALFCVVQFGEEPRRSKQPRVLAA